MRSRKKWRVGLTSDPTKRLIVEDTGVEDSRMIVQTVFDVANPQTSKEVQDWFKVMALTLLGHSQKGVAEVMGWECHGEPNLTRVRFYKGL